MGDFEICSRCGSKFPSGAGVDPCPGCLLDLAFTSPLGPGASALHEVLAESAPSDRVRLHFLGDYELLEELGRGGMGVVFRACDARLGRDVALKLIQAGRVASPGLIRRFQTEAEAAALLDHPNIVPVYEVGQLEGYHYLAMKWIEGGTLNDLLRGQAAEGAPGNARGMPRLGPRELVGVAASLAKAVAHAHSRGVLHRDLKPGNVLLDRNGVPYVTDFGLARLDEAETHLTLSGQAVGTPAYMSPEMAGGRVRDVSIASDVWSLGAILYEMLTGYPPFEGEGRVEILRKIIESDVIPPSKRAADAVQRTEGRAGVLSRIKPRSNTARDLETICLKCLNKTPGQRYATSGALAEDLERWLRSEPIAARPPSRLELGARWLDRHWKIVAPIVAACIGVGLAYWHANRQARRADAAEQTASDALGRMIDRDLQAGVEQFGKARSDHAAAHLAGVLRRAPAHSFAGERLLMALADGNLLPPPRLVFDQPDGCRALRLSPDGSALATAGMTNVYLWDLRNGQPLAPPIARGTGPNPPIWSRNGRFAFCVSFDGVIFLHDKSRGDFAFPPVQSGRRISTGDLAPDGKTFATGSPAHVSIWDSETGRQVGHSEDGGAHWIAYSSDGKHLLTPHRGEALIRDAATAAVVARLRLDRPIISFHLRPRSTEVVVVTDDNLIRRWDFASTNGPTILEAGGGPVRNAGFSLDGDLLGFGADAGFRLVDFASGNSLLLASALQPVSQSRFSLDNRRLTMLAPDSRFHILRIPDGAELIAPFGPTATAVDWDQSFDGNIIAAGSAEGRATIWNREAVRHAAAALGGEGHAWSLAFSPDGKFIATAGGGAMPATGQTNQGAVVWSAGDGRSVFTLRHDLKSSWVAFSRDGRRIGTVSDDRTARVWDAGTGAPVTSPLSHPGEVWSVDFHPAGELILTACSDGTARVWRVEEGEEVLPPLGHPPDVLHASYSPDGSRIVTAGRDGAARLWDAETHRPIGQWMAHSQPVRRAKFSPDGRKVATASFDGTARIWDGFSGQPLTPPMDHALAVYAAEFSPDGRRLLTASDDATARIWEVETGRPLVAPMRHDAHVNAAAWDHAGRRIATGSDSSSVQVWDAQTGWPLCLPIRCGGHEIRRVEFSPDDGALAVAVMGGVSRLIALPNPKNPPPAWLAPFMEAVVGLRLSPQNQIEKTPASEVRAALDALRRLPVTDEYVRWARWFLDGPPDGRGFPPALPAEARP